MDQREVLRKMAFTALGLVLAIEIVAIAGADAQPAESVYAQGEYVQTLEGAKSPFADVVQTVMPCVVGVSNRANTFNMISGQTELIEQATGSGVVVTTQGHVVTNYHVIEGANDVQVLSQGRYLKTEIVGYDELTDLAVLRVMEDVHLPAVKMGDIAQVRVGDWAIVIGNPLGKQFADTVTVGVVSALNRELEGSSIVKMLQTDGHSGGRGSASRKQHHPIRQGDAPEARHFRHNHPRKRQTDRRFYSGRCLCQLGFSGKRGRKSRDQAERHHYPDGWQTDNTPYRFDQPAGGTCGRGRGDTDGLSNPRSGKADAAGCDSRRRGA